jgi:hypothetical protein
MAQKTVELLLSLDVEKPKGIKELKTELDKLEKEAELAKKTIKGLLLIDGAGAASVRKAKQNLTSIEDKIADIDAAARKMALANKLKEVGDQANRTRDTMDKLAQVSGNLIMAGGATVAPFLLSMNKYLETASEDDPTAKRMRAIGAQLETVQTRLGKLTTEQVLPLLEKVIPYVDKAIAFLEKNPGLVSAALTIGGGLIAAGGIMGTFAQVAGTLATIQGLMAGAGVVGGAGGAAGMATALTSAITAALPAIGTVILGVLASPLTWAAAALVLIKPLMNWLLGTDYTWKQIGENGKKALIIIGYGIDRLLKGIGMFFTNFGTAIANGMEKLGQWISDGISRLLSLIPGHAAGGYMPTGLHSVSERNVSEFAMSGRTTKAAETLIGGRLSQENLLSTLAAGKRITYNDQRRIDSRLSNADRALLVNDVMSAMAGAI